MRFKDRLYLSGAAIALAAVLAAAPAELRAQTAVAIDNDDIGGVVTGASGPEAGVWVIAETTDLPTRYAKMVVTDDQGRYVVPDLPKAKYKVWVRGYGLVNSPKVDGEPGKQLDLKAVAAPNEAEAAKYYPAIYWYSMLKIPDASEFGKKDNDIPDKITQAEWLSVIKNRACVGCHQLGQLSTRTIPAAFGEFKSGEDAWRRRTMSGQAAPLMINPLAGYLGGAPYRYFGDWTDRVAKGELPHAKPPRPQGVERNVVVTTWDWGNEKQYLHDLISSDRRNPTVNANGKLFGSPEYATDVLPILDPKTHTVTNFKAPVRDPKMPESLGPGHAAVEQPVAPSAYWGEEKIWDSRVNNHNSMFDGKGRVWLAAAIRGPDNPDFCKKGSEHPSAKAFPIEKNVRQVSILDPQTMKYTFVDTCFGSHHLQFDDQGPGVDQRRRRDRGLGRHENLRRDRRRRQGAGLVAVRARHQWQRQARRIHRAKSAGRCRQGRAHHRRLGHLCRHAEPRRRLDLVHRRRVRGTRRRDALRSRHATGRGVQRPDAGLRPARRRHRQQGRGVGVARQRPHRQLRSQQVQGARSTAPRRPGTIVRRAGRSISIRSGLPGHR